MEAVSLRRSLLPALCRCHVVRVLEAAGPLRVSGSPAVSAVQFPGPVELTASDARVVSYFVRVHVQRV